MEKKRILIVEDEVIVAMTLEDVLQKLGYQVAGSVTNGPDAIQMAGEEMPDLVLMDIRLDGSMDGIEAATRISNLYAIPVVYLTAHSDQETLTRAIQTQPYGYLLKPFHERALYTTIEMAFHKHSVIRKTSDTPIQETPRPVRVHAPERRMRTAAAERSGSPVAQSFAGIPDGLEWNVLDNLDRPVCVVDKNLRLVLFNDAFRNLSRKFSASECVKKQMIYEAGPSVLVGATKDYQEVFARNKPLCQKNVFRQGGQDHIVEIQQRPLRAKNESFVVTTLSDATYTEMLESRNHSLFGAYDEVTTLLGEIRGLNGNSKENDIQQIARDAERVFITLSQLDAERLKYRQNPSRKMIWDN